MHPHATRLFPQADNRRKIMLRYVSECDPEEVATFVDNAPPTVVAAMRHTVANIVGTLPSNFFEVKVSTVGTWEVLFAWDVPACVCMCAWTTRVCMDTYHLHGQRMHVCMLCRKARQQAAYVAQNNHLASCATLQLRLKPA